MLLPLLATIIPATVLAQDEGSTPQLSFRYIELNYLLTDSDDADETVGGLELLGSFDLPLNFFGQASISRQSNDADLDQFRLGAGYRMPIGENVAAYALLSFARIEVDDSGDDFDDNGVAGELGARMLASPKLELDGAAKWVNVDNSDFGLSIGARWYFTPAVSVGGRVDSIEGEDSIALGARFQF